MISQWIKYLQNSPGVRQVVVAGTVSIGVICFSLPETLFISRYKKFLAKHDGDETEAVPQHLTAKIESVLDAMYLPIDTEARLEFFMPVGIDPVHKGSSLLRSGAIVGIPSTFNYSSTNEVETSGLKLNSSFIDWYSNAGFRLKDSLILSENSKNFAIAREIFYASDNHLFVEIGLKSLFFGMAYGSGFFLNSKYQLKNVLKLWGRLAVYTFLGSVCLLMYIVVSDTYHCSRDDKVDILASNLGSDYAEGGLQYYSKQISRNIAMRELLGVSGPSTYSVYGNELSSWRRSSVELTKRMDNMRKIYENLDKSITSSSDIKIREGLEKLKSKEAMNAETTIRKAQEELSSK